MRTPAWVFVAVALLGAAACGKDRDAARGARVDARHAPDVLEQTPWLDRAPESEKDVIHAWVFQRGEGVYFVGNAYKGAYEVIRYFVEDDRMKIRFLEDGSTHDVRFRIERVDDRVFDYRLVLDRSPRGPKVYYGFDPRGRGAPPAARAVIDSLPTP